MKKEIRFCIHDRELDHTCVGNMAYAKIIEKKLKLEEGYSPKLMSSAAEYYDQLFNYYHVSTERIGDSVLFAFARR